MAASSDGEVARYLPFETVVRIIAAEGVGPIRDEGLLESALLRPATSVMGEDAYPSLALKAAALLHSVCLNHALVDGNNRLAAIAALVFVEINGYQAVLNDDQFFDLVMAVADRTLQDVADIAARLPLAPRG